MLPGVVPLHGQFMSDSENMHWSAQVAFSAFTDFGAVMALAIAVHNIPEVIQPSAIACPPIRIHSFLPTLVETSSPGYLQASCKAALVILSLWLLP